MGVNAAIAAYFVNAAKKNVVIAGIFCSERKLNTDY